MPIFFLVFEVMRWEAMECLCTIEACVSQYPVLELSIYTDLLKSRLTRRRNGAVRRSDCVAVAVEIYDESTRKVEENGIQGQMISIDDLSPLLYIIGVLFAL